MRTEARLNGIQRIQFSVKRKEALANVIQRVDHSVSVPTKMGW